MDNTTGPSPLSLRTPPDAPSSPPSTLTTTLVVKLRAAITRGEIAPGTKLHLEDLRSTFGVSLSPLREALSRLAAEGFVVTEDQRGYRVAPISEANLREVMRLRCEFECFALRESIAHGTIAWEGQVVAALYRLNRLDAEGKSDNVEAWESEHRVFHATLISACGMPLLLHFCSTLHDLSDRYRRLFLEQNAIDRSVSDEHEQIAEATIRREADRACTLLRQHIERTSRNVLRSLLQA